MGNDCCRVEESPCFFDYVVQLRAGWRVVLLAVALGGLGAWGGAALIPPKYQAIAMLEVGRIGLTGENLVPEWGAPAGQTGTLFHLPPPRFQVVEPPAQTVERMKMQSFQQRVFEASGIQGELIPQLVKSTVGERSPLIEFRVMAGSPAAADKLMHAALLELTARQAEMALPQVQRLQGDLALAQEGLSLTETEKRIGKKAASSGSDALERSCSDHEDRLRMEQRQRVLALRSALSETLPPRFIESPSVSHDPVSPKKTVLLIFGLAGGFLAGAGWILFHDAWRQYRQRQRPE